MALLPITTSTRLYLRVVKLDPKLSSRLRERLVTFEHSLSVIQVYTQRNKQRERVRPVGVSTEERRAGPREECSGPALVRWWKKPYIADEARYIGPNVHFLAEQEVYLPTKGQSLDKGQPLPLRESPV